MKIKEIIKSSLDRANANIKTHFEITAKMRKQGSVQAHQMVSCIVKKTKQKDAH